MADQDLEELKQLESNIAKLEAAIVANPERKPLLSSAIDGMRQRASELEKKIKEREEREHTEKANEAAIREAVEKETALNAAEKEAYSGFLNKEFFTKSDFGALDKFYSHSWDKLTDDGKAEMSYRVWEGVRHGEYTFKELPEAVKEKEAGRIYKGLNRGDERVINGNSLPTQDKTDFINAYEAGNKEATADVLSRESFKNNTSLSAPTKPGHQTPLEPEKISASTIDAERSSASIQKEKGLQEKDFTSFNLDKITLSDAPEKISSAAIPDARTTLRQSSR